MCSDHAGTYQRRLAEQWKKPVYQDSERRKTFDAATYPNGIYDAYGNAHTQNSVFNIEDDSTITVKGDEVTVIPVLRIYFLR